MHKRAYFTEGSMNIFKHAKKQQISQLQKRTWTLNQNKIWEFRSSYLKSSEIGSQWSAILHRIYILSLLRVVWFFLIHDRSKTFPLISSSMLLPTSKIQFSICSNWKQHTGLSNTSSRKIMKIDVLCFYHTDTSVT